MRRSRTAAAAILAILLSLAVAWWLGRAPAVPPPAPPEEPPPVVDSPPAFPPPAPAPSPKPVEDPASAIVRVADCYLGNLLETAIVAVERHAGPPGAPPVATEETPGAWRVRGTRGTVVRMVATAPGRIPAERWFLLGRREEIPVHLAPVGIVTFVVHDSKGAPIPGADLHVTGEPFLHPGANAAPAWIGRTDARGQAACPEAGPARRLRVTATAPGFHPVSIGVESPRESVTIVLYPGIGARVQVLDDRDAPVSGARVVYLDSAGNPAVPDALVPETGPDGTADIPFAPALVSASGREPRPVGKVEPGGSVELRLGPAVSGGVTIQDAAGTPLAGVPVRLLPLFASCGPEKNAPTVPLTRAVPAFEARTDARGRVTIPAVIPRAFWYCAAGGVGEFPLVERELDSEALLRWAALSVPAAPTRTVETTTPLGRPFEGAEVRLLAPGSRDDRHPDPADGPRRAPKLLTDAEGKAGIRARFGTGFEIAVSAGPMILAVVPVGEEEPIRVRLRAPGIVRVAVEDDRGFPLPGALVRLRAGDEPDAPPVPFRDLVAQEAVTGPDGTAVFETPAGVPLVASAVTPEALVAPEFPVAPSSGDGPTTVALGLARRAWIAVEDQDNHRIADAPVSIEIEGLRAPWVLTGVTGKDGVLALRVPPPGWPGRDAARALVTVSGRSGGWGEFPLSALVDGGRVRIEQAPRGLWFFRVAPNPQWPHGTPFRWTLGRPDAPTREGAGSVGRTQTIFLSGHSVEDLRIRLAGSLPVQPEFPGGKGASKTREALLRERAAPDEKRAELEAARRKAEEEEALVLPLERMEVVNGTGGWARAVVTDTWTGCTARTRVLLRGARGSVLVPRGGRCRVDWEPVGEAAK